MAVCSSESEKRRWGIIRTFFNLGNNALGERFGRKIVDKEKDWREI